ncbi:MFS transporter [Lacicoccus qingdaonensis]|uniref:Predicted arabinose efflux permease, MFS family n=1 Tax=Lacicoccus qingdaonensis TaxID=576118 RepID=A0A1G9E9C7_9BACL|nr:MFS transporter [Salinicoccus qingdaonensis]SDK72759.1 Predicted arabinose efflux permease, MFS family [Salinicoccus qingdaonensis]
MTMKRKKLFWKYAIILFMTELVRGMYVLSYLPALPSIEAISLTLASIVITVHFVFDAVTNAWLGFIMRKVGARWTMAGTYALMVAAMSMIILSQDFFVLLIASALLGVSVCPIWIFALANVDEATRGKDMGFIFFSWLSGLGSGMVVMNFIIGAVGEAAVGVMIGAVVLNILMYLFIPGKFKVVADDRGSRSGSGKKRLPLKETFVILRRHMGNIPGIMLQALGVGMLLPVLPTYITGLLELSFFEYTIFILVIFALVGFSMTVLSRGLDSYSSKFTMVIICTGFFVYAVGIIWFSTLQTVWIIFLIVAFIGLCYGVMLPAWNKYLAGTIMNVKKAESWGLISSLQGMGAMIGPVVGGLTADIFGTVTATLVASGLIFLVLTIYYAGMFARKLAARR